MIEETNEGSQTPDSLENRSKKGIHRAKRQEIQENNKKGEYGYGN